MAQTKKTPTRRKRVTKRTSASKKTGKTEATDGAVAVEESPPAVVVTVDAPEVLDIAEQIADVAEQIEAPEALHDERPPAEPGEPAQEPSDAAQEEAAEAAVAPHRRRRGRRGGRKRSRARHAAEAAAAEAATAVTQARAGTTEKTEARPESGDGRARAPVSARAPASKQAPARERAKAPEAAAKRAGGAERLMLINSAEGDECRIAVVNKRKLEELFVERRDGASYVGNIYKAVVTNVEPSIQAAFIDFGQGKDGGKNGFLHISDLQPQYFADRRSEPENVGKKTPRKDRPPIQRCLRRGQEIIVQVIKEGIGTKGPTLTTYISLPGRYLVMMPGMSRIGVSRKIEEDESRRQMRDVLSQLDLPKGMGFILRTAGLGRPKRDLQRDLRYLMRLWESVAKRIKSVPAPALLYQESDLVIRTIRDVYGPEVDRIIVDDDGTLKKVREFLGIANPRARGVVALDTGPTPLFHKYGIEHEIQRLHAKVVPLPSGGSIIIESTEALVAIDVNSGRYREHDNAENTALKTNLEAAEEIARQLRLRDLGGLIICDFIDMRLDRNIRSVERKLRDSLKAHKERAKTLRMSQFGIIEMTRQRSGPSIKRNAYRDCPTCSGSGSVKTPASQTLDVLRLIRSLTHRGSLATLEIRVHPEVAHILQNRHRATLNAIEAETGCRVLIDARGSLGPDQIEFETRDAQGRLVALDAQM